MLAAVSLANQGRDATTRTARKRAISRAVEDVAFYLGNTPAVTRASYIDPRIIDRYCDGLTIAAALAEDADPGDQHTPTEPALEDRVEHAVLDLIAGNDDSEVVEELPDAA